MQPESRHSLKSPFLEERKRGFQFLRFGDFVEEEFRRYYVKVSALRARLLLGFGMFAAVFNMGMQVTGNNIEWPTLIYYLVFLLPTMSFTAYLSKHPEQHRLYQFCLAASFFMMGVIVNSIVSRQTLAGNSIYFGALMSWIFVTWLAPGMLFRHAARTAFLVSLIYIAGLFIWEFTPQQRVFSISMLIIANCIASLCYYQLERTVRHAFLESRALSELAERDGLTGLLNRRSFDEHMERLWRQSRREETLLTIILIDIDDFKAYNDHYGHQAGDDALKLVATVIAESAHRPLDFAARYGGEEFALILYGPAGEYSHELPEQITEDVRQLGIRHVKATTGRRLTVSIGAAVVMPGGDRSLAGAIQLADEALYEAKERGRNRVVVRESLNAEIETGRFRSSEEQATA